MSRTRVQRVAVTLIELMIVLTIMSVSLLLALPSANRWLKWNDRIRWKSSIENAIEQAKMHAITHGHICQVRPDRLSHSIKIEQVRDLAKETIKVIPTPKNSIIQLKVLQTDEITQSIDIDPNGLFVHAVQITVTSDGRRYSWMTDRSTGSIKDVAL